MSYVNRHIVRDARGYMLSSCLGALFEVGFMEDIIEKSKVDLSDFSEKQRLDPYYLRAICDYLYILGFLNREGENYSLSIAGLKLVTEARGVFDLLYAYFPIFENLVFLLKKEKEYGKDVLRRGRYVAKGTAELASYLPFPEVRLILQKYGIKSVLDLGCGSADFLISVCLKDQITGLGIDINEDAILYARERVQKAGANNLIKLAVGDMFHLEKLPTEFKKAEAISIMFALHEFLYEGIHKVVEMLDQIKAILPNRYVLIAELCKQSVETLRAKPSGIAEHHLFHAISKQGFASYNLWCRIFKAAQLSVVEDLRFDFSGQGYFLLKS